MRKILVLMLTLVCSASYGVIQQQANLGESYDYLAERCRDLGCIQDNIAIIDGQIAALVAKRLAFVKRSAQIKNNNVLLQKKPGFGNGNAEQEGAARAGYLGSDKKVGGEVFKSIHKMSDEYEKGYLKSAE